MEINGCCWTDSLPGSRRTNYCNAWLTYILEESFVAGYSAVPEEFDFAGYRTQPSSWRTFYCKLQYSTRQCLAHQKFVKCISVLDIQKAFFLVTAGFRHWLSGLETPLPMINWKRCPVACLPAPSFLQITNNKGNWMLKCKFTHWMLDFVLHVTFQQLSAFETSTGIYCTPSIYHMWCILEQFYEHCKKYKFHCFEWDLFPVQVLHVSWFHNSWIQSASSNRFLYQREGQLILPPECPLFCVLITKTNEIAWSDAFIYCLILWRSHSPLSC